MTHSPLQGSLCAFLAQRSLIRIGGLEAAHFLNSIISADINSLAQEIMAPAALLSPQGKILFDFLIATAPTDMENKNRPAGFLIDIAAPLAESFIRRLNLYKLRANVQIDSPQNCLTGIFTAIKTPNAIPLSGIKLPEPCLTFNDGRFPQKIYVQRTYYQNGKSAFAAINIETAQQNWDRLRIAFCLPEGGHDFPLGDNFPHDVNYDCIGAVALRKGCYIGQEVVSRMQYKALIRKRLVRVEAAQDLPPEGTKILANGKIIGRLGTVSGREGLAIIRLDKIPPEDSAKTAPGLAGGGRETETAPGLCAPWLGEGCPQQRSGALKAEKAQANSIELHFTAPPYLPQIFGEKPGK